MDSWDHRSLEPFIVGEKQIAPGSCRSSQLNRIRRLDGTSDAKPRKGFCGLLDKWQHRDSGASKQPPILVRQREVAFR